MTLTPVDIELQETSDMVGSDSKGFSNNTSIAKFSCWGGRRQLGPKFAFRARFSGNIGHFLANTLLVKPDSAAPEQA